MPAVILKVMAPAVTLVYHFQVVFLHRVCWRLSSVLSWD